jgi:hypothetical protein
MVVTFKLIGDGLGVGWASPGGGEQISRLPEFQIPSSPAMGLPQIDMRAWGSGRVWKARAGTFWVTGFLESCIRGFGCRIK